MITDKTRNLFKFIDFLHANIDNFNQYDKVILEWKEARWKEKQLSNHYKDVLEKRRLLKFINTKWDYIYVNIHTSIKNEGIFSVFADLDANDQFFNDQFSDLSMLSHTFEENNLHEILKAKRQYIEFRNDTTPKMFGLPKLQVFFERMDILMTHILEPFWDMGDKEIPVIQDIPIEDITPNPESFELSLLPDVLEDFFDSLLITHQEVICKDTDFDYFAYAITGKEMPFDKLPYKPIRLRGTIDNLYYELLDLMKNSGIIHQERKTIPPKYVKQAEKLFLNRYKKPLKLRTPK